MNFVLDASAAAGWFLPDERTDYTESIFEAVSGPDEAFIPTLWAYEIRNIVLKGIRRGSCHSDCVSTPFERVVATPTATHGNAL